MYREEMTGQGKAHRRVHERGEAGQGQPVSLLTPSHLPTHTLSNLTTLTHSKDSSVTPKEGSQAHRQK